MDGVCFASVHSCEYQVYRPAFSSLEAYGLFHTPVMFHCRATCIMWSAGKRFIFLPTYTARVLMVFDWRMSAPVRPRYSDLLAFWEPDCNDMTLILSVVASLWTSGEIVIVCRPWGICLVCYTIQIPPCSMLGLVLILYSHGNVGYVIFILKLLPYLPVNIIYFPPSSPLWF